MKTDALKYILYPDLEYGKNERHRLDLYIPNSLKSENGLILFIHGGGWNSCDKSAHSDDARFRAEQGYVSATMNYRYVSDDIHIDDILEDISSALQFLKDKCGEMKINLSKCILSGGSAGGHLCLLYAYTKRNLAPIEPVAVVCHCPPADLSDSRLIMGKDNQYESYKYEILSKCIGKAITKESFCTDEIQSILRSYSPITYVNDKTPPTVISQGLIDDIVPYDASLEFYNLLKKSGVECEWVRYKNSGHPLDKDPDSAEETRRIFTEYAKKYL